MFNSIDTQSALIGIPNIPSVPNTESESTRSKAKWF